MKTTPRPSAGHGVTPWRAIAVGTPLVVLICAIVSYAEQVISYIQIGFLQFPPAVIGVFFFLVVGNKALGRWGRGMGLSRQELMLVYCMLLIASMVSSRGMMGLLLPALIAVNYYATDANSWRELFFHNIRRELIPFDPNGPANQDVSRLFYEKVESASQIPWRAWMTPVLSWSALVVFVFFSFLCLAAILRRQWVENEKLSFPLTQLPLEFVHEDAGRQFFRAPLVWIGFALPVVVFGLNGLHEYVPTVPLVSLTHNVQAWLRVKPWSGIYYTPMFISFAAMGFFFLLPTQVLFSLWVFFVLTRVQDIVATSLGFRIAGMPLYPTRLYIGYQVAGAYFALLVYFVYSGLPHFRNVLRSALAGRSRRGEDADELLPYPVAVWGLIGSFAATLVWCVWAGVSLWVAVFEFGIYLFVVVLVMARSVAEAGMLMTETSFRPVNIYEMFGQKAALGARNVTLLSLLDAVFTRDLRGLTMTGVLDGAKIADGVGFRRRSLLVVLPVAAGVAFVVAAAIQLYLPYMHGANLMYGYTYRSNPLLGFRDYAAAAEGVRPPYNWIPPMFFGVGVVVTVGLATLRALYWWWPLHPLGYALSGSWSLIVFWFPMFAAWAIKAPLLQYSGVRGYRRFRPFFLGMIFGEFSMAVFWTGVSWLTKVRAPTFPWP